MTNGSHGQSENGNDGGTVQTIFVEVERIFAPLGGAAKRAADGDPSELILLLESIELGEEVFGEQVSVLVEKIEGIAEPYTVFEETITDLVEKEEPPKPNEIRDMVEAVSGIVSTVKELSNVSVDTETLDDVPKIVIDYLVVRYLRIYRPKVLPVFVLTGVVENATNDQRTRLNLAEIPKLVENPNRLASETLKWGDEEFEALKILHMLGDLFQAIGIPSSVQTGETVKHYSSSRSVGQELDLPVFVAPLGTDFEQGMAGGTASVGLKFLPIPGTTDDAPGIAIDPYGTLTMGGSFDLSGDLKLTTKADVDALTWGIAMRPSGGGVSTDIVAHEGDPFPELHAEAALEYDDSSEEETPSPLLGDAEGTQLDLLSFGINTVVDASSEDFELSVEAPVRARLVIQPKGGFVEELISSGIESEFETIVGYSTKSGIYFQAAGSIEAAIALEKELGPITLEEIFLALGFDTDTGEIPITASASATGTIGPFSATVKRIGIEATVSFPEDAGGRGGPVDFEIGFKPPEGVGVDIGAGPVSGGGYIEHEPDKNRYAGTLQLEFGDYVITAVGLLKTELPGGRKGYSFLLLITAELPPIQLGFGFTLNGVGGLLGVHRGMKKKPLGEAVRAGNIDSVLFPENVVANAQRIISDLRSIFPPKTDHHVVGPMAKFGWGSPKILTMDIGIVLGIPSWKITLLGKIQLVLPDEKAAIVELNLAAMGFLDIPNERLEMTASLYDSRIAMFTAKGDMVLKSSWGDDQSFMMSIGGLHPRFEPPESFPDLDRVQAWIPGLSDNLRVRLSGYLAVTPNTIQVGTNTLIHAEAGPAKVKGEWGWDALFELDPLRFRIDFRAEFEVKLWGHGLSLKINGNLRGPRPLEVSGDVTINISMLPKVEASLDVTIGSEPDERELPDKKILEKLIKEFERPQNWQAQLPEDGTQFVTIRRPEADESGQEESGAAGSDSERILTHPLGGIAVRQILIPLEYKIDTFGETEPASYNKFKVKEVYVVDKRSDESTDDSDTNGEDSTTKIGPTDGGELTEKFAKSKFRGREEVNKDEKLSGEAFIEGLAGHRSGSKQFHWPNKGNCTTASLRYETLVTDEREQNFARGLIEMGGYRTSHPETARIGLSAQTASEALQLSAVGRGEPSTPTFLREEPIRIGLPDLPEDEDGDEEEGVVVSEVIR